MNGWDWIGFETDKRIVASVIDDEWKLNAAAVFVTGFYGEKHMDQFSGCGPSATQYKFKALSVDGTVYIPDPSTRGLDRATARQWVPAPVQPPAHCVVAVK